MARIQQLHPGNYRSTGNIDDEFNSLIRYLVAGEKGDFTLGELMGVLFDSTGKLIAPLEMRLDTSSNLQYRVGTYTDTTTGWTTIVPASDIKGAPGADLGTIEGPLFSGAQSFTATQGQTVFNYIFDTTDDLFVFLSGVLQVPSSYTMDAANNTVTLSSGVPNAGQIVHIVRIRAPSISNFRRTSSTATANQAVFAFPHTESERIMVFRNGLFQTPGGSNDYTNDPATGTVTFTSALPAGDEVTILTVENVASKTVTGLMMTDDFTDTTTGFIPYSKIAISAGQIPQDRINGLAALTANRGKTFVSATAPTGVDAVAGNFWIDTAQSPDEPKFHDGVNWLPFSTATTIPSFTTTDALKSLHINSSGTALEFRNVDLSAYVPLTSVGAASGVAALDATGRLAASQIPTVMALDSMHFVETGTTTATTTFVIKRIYGEIIRIDKISVRTSSGTCDVILQVDGVNVPGFTAVGASSTPVEQNLANSITVDAQTANASKTIGFEVSNVTSAADIEIVLAVTKVAS